MAIRSIARGKLAPALAARNRVVLSPAEQTPRSILKVIELTAGPRPPGVVNVVNGSGVKAGNRRRAPAASPRSPFAGETTTGRLIMQDASQNLIPVTEPA